MLCSILFWHISNHSYKTTFNGNRAVLNNFAPARLLNLPKRANKHAIYHRIRSLLRRYWVT